MRRPYIDWLRGVAVVVMIHAHAIDAWTRASDKGLPIYEGVVRLNGLAAPLFLFLAGVAVPLAGAAGLRRHGDVRRASRAVQRRGWEIFGLAFLFRVQAWLLSPGATLYGILKVDILNVMGPCIALAAWLWGRASRDRGRLALFVAAALAVVAATSWVRLSPQIAAWPQPIALYFQPAPGRFAFFPWAALLLSGSAVGMIVSGATTPEAESRVVGWLTAGGASLFALSLVTAFFPPWFGPTEYWTTSASFAAARVGLMTFALGIAYVRVAGRNLRAGSSPMLQFGHTSLFVYWIHVELAYGVLASPLKGNLPLPAAWVAFVLFAWLLLLASRWKDRAVARYEARRAASTNAGVPGRRRP
jgi:uncharacterized membrane protein